MFRPGLSSILRRHYLAVYPKILVLCKRGPMYFLVGQYSGFRAPAAPGAPRLISEDRRTEMTDIDECGGSRMRENANHVPGKARSGLHLAPECNSCRTSSGAASHSLIATPISVS